MFELNSVIAKILVVFLAGSLTLFAALLLPTFAQDDCRPDDADNCSGASIGRCVDGRPGCVVACLWEVHKAGSIEDNQDCKDNLFKAENLLCTGSTKPATRYSICRLIGFTPTTQLFTCCDRTGECGVDDPDLDLGEGDDNCENEEFPECGINGADDPLCVCGTPPTPVFVSLLGNAIKLSSRAEGVALDINGDGMTEMLPWPQKDSDDALLAMDRNLNGRVDDGTELFGNFSPQARSSADRNGFEALKPFDGGGLGGNGDGFISRDDWVFSRLLLWTDRNRDGVSQSDELRPLDQTRIVSIDLSYRISKRIDGHGNQFKYISGIMMDSGSPGPRRKWAVDVVFSLQ